MTTSANLGLTTYPSTQRKKSLAQLEANLAIIDGAKALETFNLKSTSTLTAAALKDFLLVGYACEIIAVRAKVLTAPTGAALIVDLNINGTTAYTTQTNRPTVAISGTVSTLTLPDVVALVAGDHLSIDVDQIGSSVAGANLMVAVTVKRVLLP